MIPILAKRSIFLPGVVSALSCVAAYGLVAFFEHIISISDGPSEQPRPSERDPLLPDREGSHPENDQQSEHPPSLASRLHTYIGHAFSSADRNLSLVVGAFFLMAISKATRPFFTTYIQHRDGITPNQVGQVFCPGYLHLAFLLTWSGANTLAHPGRYERGHLRAHPTTRGYVPTTDGFILLQHYPSCW